MLMSNRQYHMVSNSKKSEEMRFLFTMHLIIQ